MSFAIVGLGTALPPFTLERERAAKLAQVLCLDAEQAPVVPVLYRQTEIEQRHIVLSDAIVDDVIGGTRHTASPFLPDGRADDHGPSTAERMRHYVAEAGPLACQAARRALDESGLSAAVITHLVTVSCTGFSAPGVDCQLIHELKLPATVERTHVGFMGCHGAINGLRVAQGAGRSGPPGLRAAVAVELCSLHYHYGWDPKRVVANALFADGAAALVGRQATGWRVRGTGSCLFPDSENAMTWNIGDHGFHMTLSTRVPNLIEQHLRPWLAGWLARHGLTLADIGSWAVHPGGPRVLQAVARALKLDVASMEVSRQVLTQHGNMSSPTILFILDRLRRRGARLPCVALGFGPGLVVEGAIFGA